MSKINTPETDTTEHSGTKGCGCGGQGKHSTEKAGKAAAATRKPEDAAHGHARDPEHSSGCCGGRKAHK